MIHRKKIVLIIVLMLIIIFAGTGTYAMFKAEHQSKALLTSETPKVTLEIFSGTVFVTNSTTGKETEATNGQALTVGSSIRTDATGRAQVVYSTGTVTRIDFASSMTITKADIDPQEITVSVTAGRVWSRVKKLLGKESYETQTGTVVAAVRGTSYGHGILADGRNKITTTKRTVSVHCLNDTQAGSVFQNMKFFLNCLAGSKSEIIPIDTADQDEWFQFNMTQDLLLDARFGKETYDDQGEVQGISASASPTFSAILTPKASIKPKPTPTPTPTLQPTTTTQTTSAPTPTSTPTPRPAPTATPAPKPTSTLTPTNPILFQPINPQLFRSLSTPTPTPPQIN